MDRVGLALGETPFLFIFYRCEYIVGISDGPSHIVDLQRIILGWATSQRHLQIYFTKWLLIGVENTGQVQRKAIT